MDKSPIKPGELCFITQALFPENVGRVVTTVKKVMLADGERWLCECTSQLKIRMLMEDGTHAPGFMYSAGFACREQHLRPIRDNDGETDEISRVRENLKVRKTEDAVH